MQYSDEIRILGSTEFKEKIKPEDTTVLIVDFYFSYKILTSNNRLPADIYVNDLQKIMEIAQVNRIELILDDNLYMNFKEKCIDPIKEYCRLNNIGGLAIQVPSKKILLNSEPRTQQRADAVISSRLGFYFPLVDNIILFSGDSDFVPVVKYLVKYSQPIFSKLSYDKIGCKNFFVLFSEQAKYKEEFLEFFGGKSELDEINNSCFLVSISSLTSRKPGEFEDIWD
jgi:hypothetical protein